MPPFQFWYRDPANDENRLGEFSDSKKQGSDHKRAGHNFKRNSSLPGWHGGHSARCGLGSNLYRLGVPEMAIQRILRQANVSTTATLHQDGG
jgi:hypothetical protein